MRIAFLQSPFIPLNAEVCGGLERTELAELAELNRRGHRAELFVPRLEGRAENVRVIRGWNPRHPALMWKYYIDYLSRTRGCGILHGVYAPPLLLLAPRRSVLHLQGLSISWLPYYRFFKKRYHRAHYILVAEHVKRSYLEIYPELPPDHLHVLHNAADTNLFRPAATRNARKEPVLAYASLWEEPKGIFDLLEAARILKARGLKFRINLAGSPFFEGDNVEDAAGVDRRVRKEAAELGNVDIWGALTHPRLAGMLRQSDIGVFPSNHPEPFGLAIVEMMASGLPVAAYRIGGAMEAVEEGRTGLLAENRDVKGLAGALESLIREPGRRRAMGRAGRRRAEEKFSWGRHVDGLLAIYRKVLQG